jgi:microsomal dipeptidase-like Zn-dependent dipeptidase
VEIQASACWRFALASVLLISVALRLDDGTKYVPGNIRRLFDAGYRTCSLVHLNDSPFAASASGVSKGPLTPLGREAVNIMNEIGMIIDLVPQGLRAAGHDHATIEAIMGENAIQFLLRELPQ